MAGKHLRSVIKKGLQTYAGVNAQAEQRVATSIAHQVLHFIGRFAGMHFRCTDARASRDAWILSLK